MSSAPAPLAALSNTGVAAVASSFLLADAVGHRRAIRSTNRLERLFVSRRTEIIPHTFGEAQLLKLMMARSSAPSGGEQDHNHRRCTASADDPSAVSEREPPQGDQVKPDPTRTTLLCNLCNLLGCNYGFLCKLIFVRAT